MIEVWTSERGGILGGGRSNGSFGSADVTQRSLMLLQDPPPLHQVSFRIRF